MTIDFICCYGCYIGNIASTSWNNNGSMQHKYIAWEKAGSSF